MRFSQIFLTMGYNTVVKVDKVTEIKSTESGNTMDAEYIGAFKRLHYVKQSDIITRIRESRLSIMLRFISGKECNDILRTPGTVFAYRYIGSSQPENTRRLWQNTKKDMVQVRQTLKSAR